MLILTRRPQESLVIGTDITLTVMEIRGNQVRIGVSAPDDVKIMREEILVRSPDTDKAHDACP